MNFSTPIKIKNSCFPIDYNSKIVSLGSCFAVNIGEKLNFFKFQNSINPFGIIFNPESIERLIYRAVHLEKFTEKEVFFHDERFHCFEVHSDLSNSNKDAFLANSNEILIRCHQQIKEASHIMITYGTAWVYQEKPTNKTVANCHKIPQSHFEKNILTINQIEKSIQNTVTLIRQLNPECVFLFTISPVRHIKEGFVENQRSKSHLISALQNLLGNNLLGNSEYFPSYEIMMDELRDYRFYAEDFLHPNDLAINYIWERFQDAVISESEYVHLKEIEAIQKSLLHKPFNPNSESHQKFEKKLKDRIYKIQEKFPFMDFYF